MSVIESVDRPRALRTAGDQLEARQMVVDHFASFDSTKLFYRAWLPTTRSHRPLALICLHRGHEHSGRWQEFANRLGLDDVAIFSYDARGHGRSPGLRGHAASFHTFVKDADAFVRFISQQYQIDIRDTALLGHSVGAVVAAAYAHDYAPPLRALILATPALKVKLYVPFARAGLRALNAVRRPAFIRSYVKPSMLTHDAAQAQAYAADELISNQIAVNVLLDLHDTSQRLIADAGAVRTPTLVLSAGSDWVVSNAATRRFYKRLSSPRKSLQMLDGFSHAIFHESRREVPIALVRQFLNETLRTDGCVVDDQSPIRADQAGYTRDEYERLSRPLPVWCYRRAGFAVQRAFMKTIGRLSYGIRNGWRSGFSSGHALDHVYDDVARGTTPLGRAIDRVYLDAIGWRMIRQRRLHLQAALREAIEESARRHPDRPVRVLDIAAGRGRYLLEALRDLDSSIHTRATLRDRDATALDGAKLVAHRLGVRNVEYQVGDAFDFDALAAIDPPPDVAVVSGLYELFPHNRPVLDSLRGLAATMRPGSLLIYTNQPWHPQLEMIARILVHGDGTPWIMRRRTQAEMDALVRAAGFEKRSQLMDDHGMLSVCTARRTD